MSHCITDATLKQPVLQQAGRALNISQLQTMTTTIMTNDIIQRLHGTLEAMFTSQFQAYGFEDELFGYRERLQML